jgi:hypothetical protein
MEKNIQQAVKRAKVNIALVRPEQMRQLYQACVVPVVDYASTVWHNPLKDKTHLRNLGTIQWTALIRIGRGLARLDRAMIVRLVENTWKTELIRKTYYIL